MAQNPSVRILKILNEKVQRGFMLKGSVCMFTSLIEPFENSPLRQNSVNILACQPDKDKM